AAQARKTKEDSYWRFTPRNAIEAAKELALFIDSHDDVLAIDDFTRFWDRYTILPRKINQALELAKRPLPGPEASADGEHPDVGEGEEVEEDELAAVQGLE